MIDTLSLTAYLTASLIGYGLGATPFGLVLTRIFGGIDIRTVGSGNIGATNVLRTGRKDLAFATLLLDGGKGGLAVILVSTLCSQIWALSQVWQQLSGIVFLSGCVFRAARALQQRSPLYVR